jgi:hypothetical protein
MIKSSFLPPLALVAVFGLAACEMGSSSSVSQEPATSARLVDRDIEAPEIFQTEEKALWDGRPSLGGVWVASASAKDPERVILRNPANGKFVIGGLFRREESLPGPKLQLSSDAAEALGLLAGEPAVISVTALRREEAERSAPDAAAPLLDANTEGREIGTSLLPSAGIASTASAAIDAAEAKPAPQKPAPKPAEAGPARKIQVGIFSQEANAQRAQSVLKAAGIASSIAKETSQGKDLWSVTAKGDAATLAAVKAAGFNDAYLLKR